MYEVTYVENRRVDQTVRELEKYNALVAALQEREVV